MREQRDVRTKWYYDACALDAKIVSEIVNKKSPKQAVISHLALGEAYGNIYSKGGKEQVEAFMDLIESLRRNVLIVGNDDIESIFDDLRNEVSRISITDLTHLATAIKHDCSNLRTMDRDLHSIGKPTLNKIKVVAQKYNVNEFSISRTK